MKEDMLEKIKKVCLRRIMVMSSLPLAKLYKEFIKKDKEEINRLKQAAKVLRETNIGENVR